MMHYPIRSVVLCEQSSFILSTKHHRLVRHCSVPSICMDTILLELISPDDMSSQGSVTASAALAKKDRGDPTYRLMMW